MSKSVEVLPAESNIVEFREFEVSLSNYKEQYENVIYDLADPSQGKQAKSDKLSIGKVISKLDKTHKEVKSPLKERVDLLDGERKRIKDQLLDIQDGIKSQISKHEERIKAESDALLRKASVFRDLSEFDSPPTPDTVIARIEEIKSLVINDTYGEFEALAALNKDKALQILEPMLLGLKAQEKAAQELEEARIAAEAKARKEREEQIAREAKEAAEREAQHKIEQAQIAKEAAEQATKKAAKKAEADKVEAGKRAERERAEASERAEREQREAVERAVQAAKDDAERVEQERLEAQRVIEAAAQKRESNKRHLAKINNAAAKAIAKESGISGEQAKAVVIAIAKKSIPAVTINY